MGEGYSLSSKKRNRDEGGCMFGEGEVKRKGGEYMGGGEKKKKKKRKEVVRGWWKKKGRGYKMKTEGEGIGK